MLDLLRKNAQSWMIKLILGIIVVVFIFFFGSSALRNNSSQNRTYAGKIDGKSILRKTTEAIPFENIVQVEVLAGETKKLGLRISDKELSQAIKNHPQVLTLGEFNNKTYQEVFRPSFRYTTGIEFEAWIKKALLAQKVTTLFEKSILISKKDIQTQYEIENTKIKLKRITLVPSLLAGDYKPSEEEIQKELQLKIESQKDNKTADEDSLKNQVIRELKEKEGNLRAQKLSAELWSLFKKGKLSPKLIKKHKLRESEVAPTSLLKAEAFFLGTAPEESIVALFKLTKQNPYPEAPIRAGNNIFFFKLLDKTTPDPKDFPDDKALTQEMLTNNLMNQAFEKWYQLLLSHHKIKSFDNPQTPTLPPG